MSSQTRMHRRSSSDGSLSRSIQPLIAAAARAAAAEDCDAEENCSCGQGQRDENEGGGPQHSDAMNGEQHSLSGGVGMASSSEAPPPPLPEERGKTGGACDETAAAVPAGEGGRDDKTAGADAGCGGAVPRVTPRSHSTPPNSPVRRRQTASGVVQFQERGGQGHPHAGGKKPRDLRQNSMTRTPSGRITPAKIFDDLAVTAGYESVPLIDVDRLPRGGLSLETKAIGRIQFGIPPETIKDSMLLGYSVPSVYIVPVERFCREAGPALGINLAEFEFPGYFNYFVRGKRCTLVVDSPDAESKIRRVFGETLLGPSQFRRKVNPVANEDEDFHPSFPFAARPNFANESRHFRNAEATEHFDQLCIEMLLEFRHFETPDGTSKLEVHENLGVPPPPPPEILAAGLPESTGEIAKEEARQRRKRSIDNAASDTYGSGVPVGPSLPVNLHPHVATPPPGASGKLVLGSYPEVSVRASAPAKNILQSRRSFARKVSSPSTRDFGRSQNGPRVPLKRFEGGGGQSFGYDRGGTFGSPTVPSPYDPPLETGGSPRPRLRRTVSDPDLLTVKNEEEDLMNSLANLSVESGEEGPTGQGDDDDTDISLPDATSFLDSDDEEDSSNNWTYSQAKWLGDVCTVYPSTATDADRASRFSARVEIFKMAGGTEYIVHDIDENNIIVGKARFSGTVRVSDSMIVHGFTHDVSADGEDSSPSTPSTPSVPRSMPLPSFHPPSFGVTVLGNSHGFDKKGSTSGYVLWINGRGVMIDPPPYASATLEREGIRPRMIMAIIVTHIHADHDAGAFQKVMTGSRVAIITTPTIYKSFIRKYSALSGLSPSLLTHSHRHRPAIIGKPLEFHGATFHFTYTLHTIPCIAFRVEWSGRSMVFTGDHLNSPPMIAKLQEKGVLAKERADDLRKLPLQECDLLLHESGAPPIHTQLDVLLAMPERVKRRMYVVHTAALPEGCPLRVAPTGTKGTIRLDRDLVEDTLEDDETDEKEPPAPDDSVGNADQSPRDQFGRSHKSTRDLDIAGSPSRVNSFDVRQASQKASVSDAWFVLNLLSDVPFVSSLPYAHTMELLETAQVEIFDKDEVVVPVRFRSQMLCIVWEGTCVERQGDEVGIKGEEIGKTEGIEDANDDGECSTTGSDDLAVWHPGDWTGPLSLQPDLRLSGQSRNSGTHDIIAGSERGVKVIILSMKDMHAILQSGSFFYRKYLAGKNKRNTGDEGGDTLRRTSSQSSSSSLIDEWEAAIEQTALSLGLHRSASVASNESTPETVNVLRILNDNSAFRKLSALQKRHLESIAEGPNRYGPGEPIWWVGKYVDHAYLIVSGTAIFQTTNFPRAKMISRRGSTGSIHSSIRSPFGQGSKAFRASNDPRCPRDKQLRVSANSEYARLEMNLQQRAEEYKASTCGMTMGRARDSRDRFANKVLSRLYSRRAWTSGLVFSRGHFLADTSRMVRGMLAFSEGKDSPDAWDEGLKDVEDEHHVHSSNLSAGSDGCIVMAFPRASLITFLDAHPGVLLSFLGTQIIV